MTPPLDSARLAAMANKTGQTAFARPQRVLVLDSRSENEATVRLTARPLVRGLEALGVPAELTAPESLDRVPPALVTLVFGYNDRPAIKAVERARAAGPRAPVICLGSDIYDLGAYSDLELLADGFAAPTELHRSILVSQLLRPVEVMPEAIDSASGLSAQDTFPEKGGRRLCWFGYAESFEKAMASLMPTLNAALARGDLETFVLILNEGGFLNTRGLATRPFDHGRFPQTVAAYDYAILSHFALDLSLNSFVKSPNKLVTALTSGLIPLATDTPSYGALMRTLGLERFLFSSPGELEALLGRLDPVPDSRAVAASGALARLHALFAPEVLAERFLALHARAGAERERFSLAGPSAARRPHARALVTPEDPGVRQALSRLGTALKRAVVRERR